MHPSVIEPGAVLVPAHRADLSVALALSTRGALPRACKLFTHALIWYDGERPVAAMRIGFYCRNYAFQPATAHDLREENMARLRMVFDEMGLLDKD